MGVVVDHVRHQRTDEGGGVFLVLEPAARAGVRRHQVLASVRKGRMPHIVKQCREPYGLPVLVDTACREVELAQQIAAVHADLVEHPGRRVHHAQGVLEARVHRTGVYHLGPRELPDAPQPLEHGMVDDVPFPGAQLDEPVDGIADLQSPGARHSASRIMWPNKLRILW